MADIETRLDLTLLLPELPDAQDACVARVKDLLGAHRGISLSHVVEEDGPPALCLHFDPAVLPLAQVERLAHAAGAQVAGQFGHVLLKLHAVDSEDAGQRIEGRLGKLSGVKAASVNLAAQVARVEFDRELTSAEAIEEEFRSMGIGVAVANGAVATSPAPAESWLKRNEELVWSLTAGLLLLTAWVGETWLSFPQPLALALFAAAYGFGAWDIAHHAIGNLLRRVFTFEIDLLMLLAAAGAAFLGEWAEGAFLLFLFSLAHALEHYALERARGAIEALADLAPPVARLLRAGREVEVPIAEVAAGDIVVVRPGERIPVDGLVSAGESAVNQAPITGESVPVDKAKGDQVFAGTVNGEGAMEIETTGAVGDRTLDRVIKLVEEAETQKAPTQQFTDRFERIFVPAVLVADLALIVIPPLLGIWSFSTSFYRAMTLLVAASPCALALGTPASVLAGIAQAARHGVLIKGGAYLETLGGIRAMAMDKTGTLTLGKPEVTDVIPAAGVSVEELLGVAGSVERRSQHPLAQAVVQRATADGVSLRETGDLTSLTGRGVRADLDGELVLLGNLRLWQAENIEPPEDVALAVKQLQDNGKSIMAVQHGERWLGVIGVADRPRPGVQEILTRLREIGIRPVVMLTGDNRGVGEAIGKEVGVDEVRAELMPEDKVKVIQDLLQTHGQVAMVGDGVNDAPALAQATVGIAMGGAGTAAALETADVALMADDLTRLPYAVGLSRQTKGIIRQNLCVSMGVVALLIVGAVSGLVGIGLTVLIHEGSTVIVIGNALRLLAFHGSDDFH